MAEEKKVVKVKMIRSLIGEKPTARANMRGLGLSRIGRIKVLEDTPAVRGMIRKVVHLVEIVE